MVNPPFQSPRAQPESGVRGNVPAPFGAGERLQSPTYRYQSGRARRLTGLIRDEPDVSVLKSCLTASWNAKVRLGP